MAEQDMTLYVGTVSFLLSERNYLEFVRGGLNVNQLPLLSDAVALLQKSLDLHKPFAVSHKGGATALNKDAIRQRPELQTIEPFDLEVRELYIESISFENGSVYAKIKIVATVGLIGYQGLAVYKDVKDGFGELRSDIVDMVNLAFEVTGAGPVQDPTDNEDTELRYYFVQPRRVEEEILRKRVEPKKDQPL